MKHAKCRHRLRHGIITTATIQKTDDGRPFQGSASSFSPNVKSCILLLTKLFVKSLARPGKIKVRTPRFA